MRNLFPHLLLGVVLVLLMWDGPYFLNAAPAASSEAAEAAPEGGGGGNSSDVIEIDQDEKDPDDKNCTLDLPSIAEQEKDQEHLTKGRSCSKIGKEVGDIWKNVTSPGVNLFCECVKMSKDESVVQCVEIFGEIGLTDQTCQVTKEEGIVYGHGMDIPALNMQFNCTCVCLDPETNVNKEPCQITCLWIHGCLDEGKVIEVGDDNSSGCECTDFGLFDCNAKKTEQNTGKKQEHV